MFTIITSHAIALCTASVVLSGAAILRASTATADTNQDDQFLAALDREQIPALQNVPSLIDTAHTVCRKLDGGMPANNLVDLMRLDAFQTDPQQRGYSPARVTRTITRFITAAVEAYCPYDQQKIASITATSGLMAHPARQSIQPTRRTFTSNAAGSGGDVWKPPLALEVITIPAVPQGPTGAAMARLPRLLGVSGPPRYGIGPANCDSHGTAPAALTRAVPTGENPPAPQIPAPPPTVRTMTPPRPIVAPPLPKTAPPPRQQPPPNAGPQPGAGTGGVGGGGVSGGGVGGGGVSGGGGGAPAQPAPPSHMPPGVVRLAP